jgi:hypothetical protein
MTMFINQILGCLIIAAGIGGVVGWLLRNVSAGTVTQQLTDVTAMMHLKEQMLEKARYELRDTASEMQALNAQVMASEAAHQSDQEENSLCAGSISIHSRKNWLRRNRSDRQWNLDKRSCSRGSTAAKPKPCADRGNTSIPGRTRSGSTGTGPQGRKTAAPLARASRDLKKSACRYRSRAA